MKRGHCSVVTSSLRFAVVLLFLATVGAGAQGVYVVTKDGSSYAATRNSNVVVTGTDITAVIDTIRARSYGDPITIQFGAGAEDTLDIGMNQIRFSVLDDIRPRWGEVTLAGNLKTANPYYGLYLYHDDVGDSTDLVVNSSANIIHTGVSQSTVYAYGRVSVTITGGEITKTGDGYYVLQFSTGATLNLSGGVITGPNVTDAALYIFGNYSDSTAGSVVMTGGKIVGAEGRSAITAYNYAKVYISGDAEIVGKTDNVVGASVYVSSNSKLTISGGTITNLVDSGNAVFVYGTSTLTLTGSTPPQIIGGLASTNVGSIIVSSFNPGEAEYRLAPRGAARIDSAVVVVGAGAQLSKFKYSHPYYELFKKGNDIAIKLKSDVQVNSYAIVDVPNATTKLLRVTKNGGAWTGGPSNDTNITRLLSAIQADVDGRPCKIQLGDSLTALKGTGKLAVGIYQSDGWGSVTLSGKLESERVDVPAATYGLRVVGGVSVSSSLEITSTRHAADVYVADGSDYTHTGGTLGLGILVNDATATVIGGNVRSITANSYASVVVSGGTIGDTLLESSAIEVNGMGADVVISGAAEVVSANISSEGGTILNRDGTVTISGGKVTNAAKGRAVHNSSREATGYNRRGEPVTLISGGEITAPKNKNSNTPEGVIRNYLGVLTISGTAVVSADSFGYAVSFYGDSLSATNIIGGTIKADSAAAVVASSWSKENRGKLTISGTANITSVSRYTVMAAGGSNLNLLGGTVTNTSDGIKTAIYCGSEGTPGYLTIGGSPVLNGDIRMDNMYGNQGGTFIVPTTQITIIASGENAFAPGETVYDLEMHVYEKQDGRVMLINGAAFTYAFALDTSRSNTGTKYRLAANGNDAVATEGFTNLVNFNLNGGSGGTAPRSIPVVEGGTLGDVAKPSTDSYLSPVTTACPTGKCVSDGEWHIRTGQIGGEDIVGEVFAFGAGTTGTRVSGPMTLTLSWTNVVSVLEVSRVVPAGAKETETVAIAPITVRAGEFTVGPNPVVKHIGAVSFFWSGGAVKGGKLFVYDASGSLVKKIAIVGGSKGAAASWDLTDASGRAVAGGTYAVRGVINTKSGKVERVSALIGVR